VEKEYLEDWSSYSVAHQGWIDEGLKSHDSHNDELAQIEQIYLNVYHIEENDDGSQDIINVQGTCCDDGYPVMPVWQISPAPSTSQIVNYNLMSIQHYRDIYDAVLLFRGPALGKAALSNPLTNDALIKGSVESRRMAQANIVELDDDGVDSHSQNKELLGEVSNLPHSSLTYPIFENLHDTNSSIVGLVFSVIPLLYP
jgi:hypothetical protein